MNITEEELNDWYRLLRGEVIAHGLGFNPPSDEHRELIRLNHLVMEECHAIHNKSMLEV